jgi:hypothetical protein
MKKNDSIYFLYIKSLRKMSSKSVIERRNEIHYELSTLKWDLDSASVKRKEILIEEDKKLWRMLNTDPRARYEDEQKRLAAEDAKRNAFVAKVRSLLE